MHTSRAVLAGLAAATALAAGCGSTTTSQPDRPASKPVRMAVVPNLVGVEQSAAHRLANRDGFKIRWMSHVGRLSNGHTNVSCVKIFSQSPVAGERRAVGAQISVLEIACHTPKGKWHDAAGVKD